ncbi:alpha/beta fold hydrolase [Variovorax sp. ZT4R33]|uniref:alpha/beta fold hydrolase n=1 Tax=Variovorax sp. ZT4R33 TaxID=3443743 RepID=UPI003F489A1A
MSEVIHEDAEGRRSIENTRGSTTVGLEHRFVDVGCVRTSYYMAGDSSSTPVLLLHDGAWGADAMLSWREVMINLASDHHVIAPDLAGFGQTDKVVMFGASPFEHRLRHIAGFLALLQLRCPVHVVGTSFGGSLALRAAAASAWPMASATSVAGTGGPWRVELAKRILADLEPGRDYIARVVEVLTNKTSGLDEHIDRRYENSLAPGHYAAMVSLRLKHPAAASTPVEDSYPASLADATVPVAVITTAQDQLVELDWPKHVRSVAPNVVFHQMDGPHSPNVTHPQELAEKLRGIIRDHVRAQKRS